MAAVDRRGHSLVGGDEVTRSLGAVRICGPVSCSGQWGLQPESGVVARVRVASLVSLNAMKSSIVQ